jgi:hypothetical protein
MRSLLFSAIIAAAVTAALEVVAAILGWSPATWLLASLPVAAGIIAFLGAGRRRAVRRSARRRAQPRRPSGADRTNGRTRAAGNDHGTVVRRPWPAAGREAELAAIRADEDTLAPR